MHKNDASSSPAVVVWLFVRWLRLVVGWLNLLLVVAIVAWVILSVVSLNNGWEFFCHGRHISSDNTAINLGLASDALAVDARLKKDHGSSKHVVFAREVLEEVVLHGPVTELVRVGYTDCVRGKSIDSAPTGVLVGKRATQGVSLLQGVELNVLGVSWVVAFAVGRDQEVVIGAWNQHAGTAHHHGGLVRLLRKLKFNIVGLHQATSKVGFLAFCRLVLNGRRPVLEVRRVPTLRVNGVARHLRRVPPVVIAWLLLLVWVVSGLLWVMVVACLDGGCKNARCANLEHLILSYYKRAFLLAFIPF